MNTIRNRQQHCQTLNVDLTQIFRSDKDNVVVEETSDVYISSDFDENSSDLEVEDSSASEEQNSLDQDEDFDPEQELANDSSTDGKVFYE